MAVDSTNTQFATASADSTLRVWATRDPSEEASIEYLDTKNKKRRKTAGQDSHSIKVNYACAYASKIMRAMLTDAFLI